MENEILRAAAEKRDCRCRRRSGPERHGPPAAGGSGVPRARRAPLHRVYARRQQADPARPGPVTAIGNHDVVQLIRQVLDASPFAGEGYRKVRTRLRRQHGVQVSGKRSRGWRGVDQRPANVRLLQQLRHELLDQPALECRGGDVLAEPVIPAA
jgi:hypothetical protein